MLRISRSEPNLRPQFHPAADSIAVVEVGQQFEVETAHHLALYKRELTEADLIEKLPLELLNPLTGPIAVRGAEPGDTLVIRIDDIEVGPRGDCPMVTSGGLMQGHLRRPYMRILEISGNRVLFPNGISFPVSPMIGALGTTPTTPIYSVHPGDHGGNLDDINIGPGAVVYFPVFVASAMLCIGDVHASQGDSEWCGPLEVDALVRLTVIDVLKSHHLDTVWTMTPNHWITYGAEPGIHDSIEKAALRMTKFVSAGLRISLEDSAVLLSNVGNLRLCQATRGLAYPVVRAEFPRAIDQAGGLDRIMCR